jgi:two-component system, NtrC family, sensor histidine kinase KinB
MPLSHEQQAAVEAALAGRGVAWQSPDFRETFNVVLNGRPRRFLVTAVPIHELTPRRSGAVVVLHDVTEFAQLDELRGELVGVASHELKSPLTTLRMNLLMLGEKSAEMSDWQRNLLANAVEGCEELGSTIEELLDLTRIEAGQLRLNLAAVDLEAVIGHVRQGLQSRFDDAGVHLQVIRDAVRVVALADSVRLASVFANLLTNALKYSPTGGTVTVSISSGQNAGSDGTATLQIAVTDEGPGVPNEYRERVFDKFFRVEHQVGAADDGVRGTGIGLYLCREIVKAHGGCIACNSGCRDGGTCIRLELPLGSV